MRLRTLLTLTTMFLAALGAAATPAAASPPAPQLLGSADLSGFCRSQGYAGASLTGATAYDWHCVTGDDRRADVSFAEACRRQFQPRNTVDRIGDFHDPRSVQCWSVSGEPVTPDFDTYCQQAGRGSAVLTGATVYDWHCRAGGSGALTDIDVRQACVGTVFGTAVMDRFRDFGDPYSWECRR